MRGAGVTAANSPCAWPPRSKVVKVMPAIFSSSEAAEIKAKLERALFGMLVCLALLVCVCVCVGAHLDVKWAHAVPVCRL